VLNTPPLSSSSIQETNPPLEARAESGDSFSYQPAIGSPKAKTSPVESGKAAKGLSHRFMLGGLPCYLLLCYRFQQAILIPTAMIEGIATIQFGTVVPNRSKLPVIQSPTIAMGLA
jgi:hypothetical protein